MIRVRRRSVAYGEIWFDEEPPSSPGVDILMFCQRSTPAEGKRCSRFLSLITDLSPEPDAILAQIGPQTRYQIRRSENKDGVRAEFISEPREKLEEFSRFYDAFARQKGVSALYRPALYAACEANQLVLSAAYRDGAPLVWHAYIIFGGTAGLLHTGSLFRGKGTDETRLIGRANRWLHWQDILGFRQRGLAHYNWGGLFEDTSTPDAAGINRFKEDFGGRRVCTYNALLPLTAKGRGYLAMRDLWRLARGEEPGRV